MICGQLVSNGWTYRRKSITEMNAPVGLVVSFASIPELIVVEKLVHRKGEWLLTLNEDITNVVEVLWPSGNVEKKPVCNLIEVKK